MCKQCELKPVYEFTNKRKLCKNCFINYFQKKILYTIRKFKMADHSSVIFLKNSKGFRDVVLEEVLKMFAEKSGAELIKLRSFNTRDFGSSESCSSLDSSLIKNKLMAKNFKRINNYNNIKSSLYINYKKYRGKRVKILFAESTTTDEVAEKIIYSLFEGKLKKLKGIKPLDGKIIRPLFLMLDEEILLYAKLKNLKFKLINEENEKRKFNNFIKSLEKKHPELKHSVVNSWLKLFL